MTTQILDTRAAETRAMFIPIGKLTIHESNVHRTDRRAEIETLAASIEAHGLLQNLTVVARDNGRYAVVAGGRRLAALKLLVKEGRIARDFAVPCTLVPEDGAGEASLAENVQRLAMNVMDEVDAFAALVADGASVDDVARRFGTGVRHVEQRLALARLSPKIKAAYRKGEITLDAARAFCITDDHAQQDIVFREMAKPVTHAASVRAVLTQGRMPARDRLARFVGLEAYRDAGGHIVSDLFDDTAIFLDAETVRAMAAEKLETLREVVLQEGWGWTEAFLGFGRLDGAASERLQPIRRPFTEAEAAHRDRLARDIAHLDETLRTSTDDEDSRFDTRDTLQEELDRLFAGQQDRDKALMAHAGAVISIDHDGEISIQRGVVKRADARKIDKLRRAESQPDNGVDMSDPDSVVKPVSDDERGQRLTKGLVQQLTQARTRALRAGLTERPQMALAVLVNALSVRAFNAGDVSRHAQGVDIVGRPTAVDDAETVTGARDLWAMQFREAEDTLAACLSLPTDVLLDVLALLVAGTMDLSHVGVSAGDRLMQHTGDTLAAALDLDMTRWWTPDLAFWTQAPKMVALAALDGAPGIESLPPAEKQTTLAAFARMKKAELAVAAAQALDGAGWLPDLLITPMAEGALALTASGEAAVSGLSAGLAA